MIQATTVSAAPPISRALRKILAHGVVEPESGVPHRVPDAAEHVMKQRPGEAEQHDLADERVDEA